MIVTKELSCWYDENILFSWVNLYLMRWQVSIVFWSNGTWKSSLMNVLLWLESPKSWSIIYWDIVNSTDAHLVAWYMPQKHSLWDHMTCYENILFSIKDKKLWYDRKMLDNLINKFNISGILDKNPTEISLWQKQIISFIRAIIIDSGYLLFDEPSSALDRINFQNMMDVILEEKLKNKMIFIITHDLRLINKIWDKLYVLEDKHIEKVSDINTYFYSD